MALEVLMTAKTLARPGIDLLEQAGCSLSFLIDGTEAELAETLRSKPFDAVISRTLALTSEMIATAPALRVIARHGVGHNNVDVDAATQRGIPVLIADNANGQSVAEHTLALLLAVARRIPVLDAKIRAGAWPRSMTGLQLSGRTAGIVAFGAIGQKVGHMLKAVGMNIIAFDPHISDKAAHEVEWAGSLDALLSRCDVVSLHSPLTAETAGMIDAERLARMKKGAILINTARGGLIVEEALAEAVASGHLAGAGIDTFMDEPLAADHPFKPNDRIVMTPHMGGSTDAALDGVALSAAQNVIDMLIESQIDRRLLVNPTVLDRLTTPVA